MNEDNVTVLADFALVIFETEQKKMILGYYYRRKRFRRSGTKSLVQEIV